MLDRTNNRSRAIANRSRANNRFARDTSNHCRTITKRNV